jgi:aspartyl-tRNA(Asn)/glutamyl-tRNA(Gln) amidotransferase subunit B
MSYEVVIGLEVHAQLQTKTKLFCRCGTEFGLPPNTQTCPVCLGMPGSLPVMNRAAVEMAIRTGLALHCTIRNDNRFARKNYFYPDLPKGYQISQYEEPICEHGWMDIQPNGSPKRVRIRRAHLEEDAGKNLHEGGGSDSRVDLNRTGTPLLEIVTEPDMKSPEEVDAYLKGLRDVLMYLEVCDGNMEQGSLRCEPNISLRPAGQTTLGTKVELKNINSFRFVHDALKYEIARQTGVLEEGGIVHQETRLWDVDKEQTMVMRSKEEAHDYRYFPDPDLLPMSLAQEWIDDLGRTVPELPRARQQRFISQYQLPEYDAGVLTSSRSLADYFEACVTIFPNPKTISNWVMGELLRELNITETSPEEAPVTPKRLADLLQLVENGTISLKVAREIFPEFYASGKDPESLIQEKGLTQISDDGALMAMIQEVLFFVGQVMKASKGKANPARVNELLKNQLAG